MALSSREKYLIGAAVPALLGALLWQLVWVPLSTERAALRDDIRDYTRVAVAARAVEAPTRQVPAAPLTQRVTRSADSFDMQITRITPESAQLRVALDDADFASLIQWLSDLETQERARLTAISIDRHPLAGRVSARITLRGDTE